MIPMHERAASIIQSVYEAGEHLHDVTAAVLRTKIIAGLTAVWNEAAEASIAAARSCYDARLNELEAERDRLKARCVKYRERLEIDRHWEGQGLAGLRCVYLPFDQDESVDGIEARDEAIKLLQAELAAAKAGQRSRR